jgi:hypothetical protein
MRRSQPPLGALRWAHSNRSVCRRLAITTKGSTCATREGPQRLAGGAAAGNRQVRGLLVVVEPRRPPGTAELGPYPCRVRAGLREADQAPPGDVGDQEERRRRPQRGGQLPRHRLDRLQRRGVLGGIQNPAQRLRRPPAHPVANAAEPAWAATHGHGLLTPRSSAPHGGAPACGAACAGASDGPCGPELRSRALRVLAVKGADGFHPTRPPVRATVAVASTKSGCQQKTYDRRKGPRRGGGDTADDRLGSVRGLHWCVDRVGGHGSCGPGALHAFDAGWGQGGPNSSSTSRCLVSRWTCG